MMQGILNGLQLLMWLLFWMNVLIYLARQGGDEL